MKCLTENECAEWLASRGLTEAPYDVPGTASSFYKQFRLPDRFALLGAMFRALVATADPFKEALIHITDWSLYQPDEMETVQRVRAACGERAALIQKPGHVFSWTERDLLVGFLTLVSGYNWSAYGYFDNGLTLLSWEGELLDVWCSEHGTLEKCCAAVTHT